MDIPAWTVLGAYGGELLTADDVDARYPDGRGQYVMNIGSGMYRDAVDPERSNWLRYINSTHKTGTAPNCMICRGGVIRTIRRVRASAELLMSYGRAYKGFD